MSTYLSAFNNIVFKFTDRLLRHFQKKRILKYIKSTCNDGGKC